MVFSQLLIQALHEEVVGQEYAITALTRAVTLALAGMRRPNRPLAVLAFVGPTGSGKTFVAQALARVLLADESRIAYVDCERLSQSADPVSQLREQPVAGRWNPQASLPSNQNSFLRPWLFQGTLPGSWQAGRLQQPFSIVVFDEADKASSSFRENLAGAIDRGWMLSDGEFLTLANAFVILTATVSRKKTDQLIGRSIGFFSDGEADRLAPGQHLLALQEMDAVLGPRLVGRVEEIIIFEHLNEGNVATLLERKLAQTERFLACSGIGFTIDHSARTFLLNQGLEDLAHGMRQIKRAISNNLEFPLADLMLSGRLLPGMLVAVNYQPPGSFLNFQIMIPQIVPPDMPAMKPIALEETTVN
jgi:ATP-dependent Clp protease ATP-binding subunit ClpA